MDLTNNFTIETYLKQDSTDTYEGIISRAYGAPTDVYALTIHNNDIFVMRPGVDSWWDTNYTVSGDGWWRHIAVTFDDAKNLILYVNGTEEASVVTSVASYSSSTRYSKVGYHSSGFVGTMAYLKLYNVCLSPTEVAHAYNRIARQAIYISDGRGALPDEKVYTLGERVIF
jgi:hypothetical protein